MLFSAFSYLAHLLFNFLPCILKYYRKIYRSFIMMHIHTYSVLITFSSGNKTKVYIHIVDFDKGEGIHSNFTLPPSFFECFCNIFS